MPSVRSVGPVATVTPLLVDDWVGIGDQFGPFVRVPADAGWMLLVVAGTLAFMTYADAAQRSSDPAGVWAILVLLFPPVFVFYLVSARDGD